MEHYADGLRVAENIAKLFNLHVIDHSDWAGVKAQNPAAAKAETKPRSKATAHTQAVSRAKIAHAKEELTKQTHTDANSKPSEVSPLKTISSNLSGKPIKKAMSDDELIANEMLTKKFEEAESCLPKKYFVLGLIGEGGMASVFKVRDGKLYAAKLLAPDLVRDSNSLKRFEQEAQSAERLKHPAIAGIHEFGMGGNGTPYLVMQYMPGLNLAEFLHIKHKLGPARALPIFVQVADAAEYAHKMGVIHRDIKPSNIIIHNEENQSARHDPNASPSTETASLVDFGIAKTLTAEDHAPQGLTKTGEIFGSPLYMSPEQCEGINLDARSDIYALGCVMYETLAGKPPFQSDNPIELILRHLEDEPASFVPEIQTRCTTDGIDADDLNYIVLKCLRKDPSDRYQSMAALKTALVDCVNAVPITRDKKGDSKNKKGTQSVTTGEHVCDVCGKPIGGIARTDVTRYLSWESRCQCKQPGDVYGTDDEAVQNHHESQLTPEQCAAAAANLPAQYEIVSLLGKGGMGAVFKVKDKTSGKFFAVKMLKPQLTNDARARKRFQSEAGALSALTCANVAAVYDFGVGSGGAPYLVMDYLEGKTLAEIISSERCLGVPRAVDIFKQVAEAMSYAHKHGIIHRDLKPSNVMIDGTESGTELAKLMDFGVAKNMVGGNNRNTQTGEVIGSPPYMSPEQCIGKKLDERSDIYSFGCLMYESLCGHPPFQGKNQVITIVRHVKEEAESIAKVSKAQPIPDDLDYIVMRCLRKQPGDRYQHMNDIVNDLDAFAEHKPIKRIQPNIKSFSLHLRWPFWK
jgi:serine/threonine protein kinase